MKRKTILIAAALTGIIITSSCSGSGSDSQIQEVEFENTDEIIEEGSEEVISIDEENFHRHDEDNLEDEEFIEEDDSDFGE